MVGARAMLNMLGKKVVEGRGERGEGERETTRNRQFKKGRGRVFRNDTP
jgi:hypothetical protein